MISIFVIITGFLILIYNKKVTECIGAIDFAEKFFGTAGTYTLVKIVGLLCIILSFMWLTGGLQRLLLVIFRPFIGGII